MHVFSFFIIILLCAPHLPWFPQFAEIFVCARVLCTLPHSRCLCLCFASWCLCSCSVCSPISRIPVFVRARVVNTYPRIRVCIRCAPNFRISGVCVFVHQIFLSSQRNLLSAEQQNDRIITSQLNKSNRTKTAEYEFILYIILYLFRFDFRFCISTY